MPLSRIIVFSMFFFFSIIQIADPSCSQRNSSACSTGKMEVFLPHTWRLLGKKLRGRKTPWSRSSWQLLAAQNQHPPLCCAGQDGVAGPSFLGVYTPLDFQGYVGSAVSSHLPVYSASAFKNKPVRKLPIRH